MGIALQSEFGTTFPTITFRKKRLTVTISAYFDLDGIEDAASAKKVIEDAVNELAKRGRAKHTYSVMEI